MIDYAGKNSSSSIKTENCFSSAVELNISLNSVLADTIPPVGLWYLSVASANQSVVEMPGSKKSELARDELEGNYRMSM
jgi:hypothetical protein